MALREAGGKRPSLQEDTYVDESALLIGDVTLRERASVWPCALLRADDASVQVGEGSAVMDMAFVEAPEGLPVRIGAGCLVSHGARLHGCVIEDGVLVGVGAIVLDGARVGRGSIVAAGSLVPPEKEIPAGSVASGTPAAVVRPVTEADTARIRGELDRILEKAARYARERRP